MKIDKTSAALGAAAAVIVGAAGVTYATMANADTTPTPSPSGSATAPRNPDAAKHLGAETELIGATAAKVKAAVLAKLPGATVERMSTEDPAENTGAAYEAHVTKSDGTHVEVLLDKAYAVLSVKDDQHGFGRHGPGGFGHNETELSGATAAKVK